MIDVECNIGTVLITFTERRRGVYNYEETISFKRKQNDRCGECGGVAEYFNIDPTLVSARLGACCSMQFPEQGSLHILSRQSLCRMHEFLIIPETVLTNPFLPDMIVFS